nr:MAG TPA: hypothetical protein [Caudoviricetes sp.]
MLYDFKYQPLKLKNFLFIKGVEIGPLMTSNLFNCFKLNYLHIL